MIARVFGWTVDQVRAHSQRDLFAYAEILRSEQRRQRMRKSAAGAAKPRRSRK
jgi:hypothetical protein